ncbi:NYN domain-containing protein, partial [Lachnotalea glycerini]
MKTMIFIDHMNFYLAAQAYYHKEHSKALPTFDYARLIQEIHKQLPFDSELIKTQIFFPLSEAPLDSIEPYKGANNWLSTLKTKPYLDIIEGRNQIRKLEGFDIKNSSTYTVDEKGTDINIATQMLTKAFHNSYDCAILVSGDSDYVPVIEVLRTIGKITVVACLKGQVLNKRLADAKDSII